MNKVMRTLLERRFLFEELVKRDFKQKYKRTVLGTGWSVLSPLLTLLVMRLVFTHFFGRNMEFYTTYLFAGNLMFSYFRESTNGGMLSLMANSNIITKINVPKYLFLFSKNISAVINFGLTLVVFFIFTAADGVPFRISMFGIVYPIITLTMFNVGAGLVLSALFVFFRDTQYLYDVFTTLLMYLSAIFYNVDAYSARIQRIFLLNPVYCNIKYVRVAVIDGHLPSAGFHLLLLFYGAIALFVGGMVYKKCNQKFLYYM
jgi:ABC-2 type transport system permease protein